MQSRSHSILRASACSHRTIKYPTGFGQSESNFGTILLRCISRISSSPKHSVILFSTSSWLHSHSILCSTDCCPGTISDDVFLASDVWQSEGNPWSDASDHGGQYENTLGANSIIYTRGFVGRTPSNLGGKYENISRPDNIIYTRLFVSSTTSKFGRQFENASEPDSSYPVTSTIVCTRGFGFGAVRGHRCLRGLTSTYSEFWQSESVSRPVRGSDPSAVVYTSPFGGFWPIRCFCSFNGSSGAHFA
mmetsp:Transcript_106018/g.167414  ORF Transcript_106018/g.167414 Transcript_106018/m.167414 type:complete len:247 (+) Transcript_106018:749-1489(+)